MLYASGLGLRYPQGYPVGRIVSVTHSPHYRFAKISVKPAAHLARSRLFLLVWSEHTPQQKLRGVND